MSLTSKEQKIFKGIHIGSDNDPRHPEFPPNHPRFPATPTYKINVPGFSNVWLKDESKNPTGTHKDRLAWEIVCQYRNFLVAKKLGLTHGPLPIFSIISSGNAALALGYYLKSYGLPRVKILVDYRAPKKEVKALQSLHCDVYTTDLSVRALNYQDILRMTDNQNGFDITSNNALDPRTIFYDWMSFEIINNSPDYVLVPFGTGDLYENVCNAIKREVQTVKKQDPRLMVPKTALRKINVIGATVNRADTKADKLYSPHLPFTDFNEQWLRFYKQFAYVNKDSGVFLISEDTLEEAYELAHSQGIDCEYSGIAGLAYLLENKLKFKRDKKILIVNTGRGKFELCK